MPKQVVKQTNVVIKATKRDVNEINVDGRHMKLDNKHHQNFVDDHGLANEIEARHSVGKKGEVSKDFVVSPVALVVEQGHSYFFGSMPEMPWKRKKVNTNEKTENA